MEKIWKKVIGFENYSVSSFGEVRNDIKNKILKNRITDRGYYSVILYNNGNTKSFRVHRLILSCFDNVDYTDHYLECNHKDEDKSNNNLSNLNWVTRKENMNWNNLQKRMRRVYTHSQYRIDKTKEILSVKIKQINIITGEEKIYNSISDAKKEGFSGGNISACCLGKRKQHKGFYWIHTEKKPNRKQILSIK